MKRRTFAVTALAAGLGAAIAAGLERPSAALPKQPRSLEITPSDKLWPIVAAMRHGFYKEAPLDALIRAYHATDVLGQWMRVQFIVGGVASDFSRLDLLQNVGELQRSAEHLGVKLGERAAFHEAAEYMLKRNPGGAISESNWAKNGRRP